VTALYQKRPADLLRLYYTDAQKRLAGPICAEMARSKRPYRMLEGEEMVRAAGTTHHGGIAAVAVPRAIPVFDPAAPPRDSILLVLDGVGNPHNLGAIARSAGFFGVRNLLLHTCAGAALPSDAAYRTAEGALEGLNLYRTDSLPHVLKLLKPFYRVVATSLRSTARPLAELPRDRPIALVLGHEEHGVSDPVLAVCRREICIEGSGPVQSLNVAQAAAVLLAALAP
jgi:TrmH RNA methyltransferase